MGLRSKQIGDAFEALIQLGADRYHAERRALILKLAVPIRMTADGRVFRSRVSPFDWYGAIAVGREDLAAPNARRLAPFAMETKSNTLRKPSLAIRPKTKGAGVAFHQLDALADWIAFGNVGALLWDNGGAPLRLAGPDVIRVRDSYLSGGRKSIPFEAFERIDALDRFLDGLA